MRVRGAVLMRELVIRTPNRVGLLADIATLLAEKGINILALYVSAREEEAEIHLLTEAQLYARKALEEAEYPVEQEEVVLLELPHRPGFLRRVTETLRRNGLDIRYLYATAPEWSGKCLVVFSCDNNGRALELLRER
ncbi:ACT domain-containing protein [Candidatus Bipolaricaulota bacterium]|nr:ACT domain-containing protein [Candidatus Bipolaricaulota bacterium]